MDRRQFLTTTAGAAIGAFTAAAPAIAQGKTKLRVGYLHTVAVDGQIWTGMGTSQIAFVYVAQVGW